MPKKNITKLSELPIFKFILILGVIFIHCNIKDFISSDYTSYGPDIVSFITSLMQVCVPSFFIISGYLFFYGVERFTIEIYKKKLSSRFKTLFIPYIIWNSFCAVLFIIKVFYFNFPGLGIIENDTIHWGKFFEGFIYREQTGGYPYAFAFWFIRNLIAFVLLTPIVWLIARKWWSVILLLAVKFIFDIDFYGIEWFLLGASGSIHTIRMDNIKNVPGLMLLSGAIYFGLAILRFWFIENLLIGTLMLYVEVMAGFCFVYILSSKLIIFSITDIGRQLCSSTFFIYAFHQCFCSVTLKFWLHIIGYDSISKSLFTYILTFLSLFTISFLTYLFVNRFYPKTMRIISGNRA